MSDHESCCVAKYTTRDLILYALGIGCTSKCCGEERFLIENQHNFEAFPLYPLALGFTSIPKTIIDAKKKKSLLDTSKKGFDYAFWGIHPFPPYSMRHYSKNGTFSFIPERFIVSHNGNDEDDEDEDEDSNSFNDPFLYPMIHISQSLSIFHNMPVPCRRRKDQEEDSSFHHHESENPISIETKTSIVKVVPKRIGTFVTTKTDFYLKDTTRNKETHNSLLLLSTGYSCSLILNVPSEKIIPFHDNRMLAAQFFNGRTPTNQWNNFFSKDKGVPPGKPDFTHTFNISDDQAILYRLSGDYNPLHVDSNISSSFLSSTSSSSSKSSHKNKNKTRPILHGLCTLGFAVRAALQYCDSISGRHSDDKHIHQLVHVFTKFKRPVFIGDELLVHIWNITHPLKTPNNNNNVSDTGCIDLLFQVTNLSTKSLCLDEGVITVNLNPDKQSLGLSKL